MAEMIQDSLGRTIKASIESLGKMLQSKVGAPTKFAERKSDDSPEVRKTLALLDKIEGNTAETLKETRQQAKAGYDRARSAAPTGGGNNRMDGGGLWAKVSKSLNKLAGGSKQGSFDSSINKAVEETQAAMERQEKSWASVMPDLRKLIDNGLKRGSIFVHDENVEKAIDRLVRHMRGEAPPPAGGGGGAGGGRGGGGLTVSEKELGLVNNGLDDANKKALTLGQSFQYLAFQATGGLRLMDHLLGGIQQGHDNDYMQDMRAIAYQTEGVTARTGKLQKQWESTNNVVAETGFNLSFFQKAMVDNMRKGVRSRQDEVKLMKTGMSLATMIGSEVNSTAGLFHDWHVRLGMSNNEMSEISRGVQQVARSTGITGDNLLAVVKASEKFVKNMRDSATLTTAGAKNMMLLQAHAEKAGIADEASQFFDVMADTTKLYTSASNEVVSLMVGAAAHAGRFEELTTGTLRNSKPALRDMARGLEGIAQNFGTSMEEIDRLATENPQKLRALNIALQSAYGIQAGQLVKIHESFKNAGRTFADQQASIRSEMDKSNLTTQERIRLEGELRRAQLDVGLEFLTAFDKGAKNAKSMQEAVQKASVSLGPDFEENLKAIGANVADPLQRLQAVADYTANKLKEAGGQDFGPELQKAIQGQDISAVRDVLEKINTEQQKLGVAEAKSLDPLTEAGFKADKINETLREFHAPALRALYGILGSNGLILATLIGGMNTNGLAAQGISKLTTMIGGIFRGGGRAAGSVGGAAAGGVASAASTAAISAGVAEGVENSMARNAPKMGETMAERMGFGAGGKFRKLMDKVTGHGAAGGAPGGPPPLPRGGPAMPLSAGAAAGVKVPPIDTGGMMRAAPQLLKGALALGLVAAGLTAIALSIVGIAKAILKISGMTPEEVGKMGLMIGGLIAGLGVIAVAIIGAQKGLELLQHVGGYSKQMFVGAATLLVLAPAIVALAGAVTWMSGKILAFMGLDPKTSADTATAVGAILMAAAKITAGVLLGSVALAALGAGVMALWGPQGLVVAGLMLAGAAALLVLTPAVVGLATAVIGIAAGIMKMTFDPAEAELVASGVGSIIGSAAKIALGVVGTMAGLAALGLMTVAMPVVMPLMMIGAASLFRLTPAMLLLSSAIINMTSKFMGMVTDPGQAAETSKAVSDLIGSASSIAWSVTKMAGGLTILGVLGALASVIVPLMVIGGGALMVLTPAMIKMATTILDMGKGLSTFQGGIKGAEETAAAVGGILSATSDIVGAVLKSSALVAGLGLLATLGPVMAVMMYLGIRALKTIAPPLQSFMGVVMVMAQGLAGITNEKDAQRLSAIIGAISNVIASLASAISAMNDKLMPLVQGGLITDSIAENLIDEKDEILGLVTSLSDFAKGTVGILQKHFSDADMANVIVASKLMTSIGTMMVVLSDAMGAMSSKLMPLTEEGLFTDSAIENLGDAAPDFAEGVETLANFARNGVIEPLKKTFPDAEIQNIGVAASVLRSIGSMITTLGEALGVMHTKILPLTDQGFFGGDSDLEKLDDNKDRMANYLSKVAVFVRDGVIGSIHGTFTETRSLEDAARKLEIIAKIMNNLMIVLGVLSSKLAPIVQGNWSVLGFRFGPTEAGKMLETAEDFGKFFGGLAGFMKEGIIKPISGIFAGGGEDAATKLDLLGDTVDKLAPFLGKLGQRIRPLLDTAGGSKEAAIKTLRDQTQQFGTFFSSLSGFMKAGIVDPINNIGSVEDLAAAGQRLDLIATMLLNLVGVLDRLSAVVAKLSGGNFADLGGMVGGVNKALGELSNLNTNLAPNVGLTAGDVGPAAGGSVDVKAMLAEKNRRQMAGGLTPGSSLIARDPNLMALEREATGAAANLAATGTRGGYGITAAARGEASMPGAAAPASMASPTYTDARVEEQRAGTSTQAAASKDMGRIADAHNQSLNYLRIIAESNQQLVALMTPAGTGAPTPSPRSDRRQPGGPVDYGQWQFGTHQGNASRGIKNDGM